MLANKRAEAEKMPSLIIKDSERDDQGMAEVRIWASPRPSSGIQYSPFYQADKFNRSRLNSVADPKRFDSVPYPAFHLVSDPAKTPDPFIFNQIKLQKNSEVECRQVCKIKIKSENNHKLIFENLCWFYIYETLLSFMCSE